MSNFVQTMKDWRRLCRAMATDDGCNDCCPLLHISPDGRGCDAIYADEFADNVDWNKLEQRVKKWAAEHPVVYPTWSEWFIEKGILPDGYYHATNDLYLLNILEKAMQTQISDDTAQKLDVKPKEQEAR